MTRSVLAATLVAFRALFHATYTLPEEVERLLGKPKVPVQQLTDRKSLFEIISKGNRASEKRLMDITCAREGYCKFEIDDINFVRSRDSFVDVMAKKM